MLSPGIIIGYMGDRDNIPEGFELVEEFDSLFIRGSTIAGQTGGTPTHGHSSPAHGHTHLPHGHSVQTSGNEHRALDHQSQGGSSNGSANHFHAGTISTLTNVTVSGVPVTYSEVSNNPQYIEVLFIRATGYRFIPPQGVILSKNNNREGFDFFTSAANRFLRGAPGNPGDIGGSNQNEHQINHAHETAHGHTGNTGTQNVAPNRSGGSGNPQSLTNHSHPVTLNVVNLTSETNTPLDPQSEIVEPAFIQLNIWINNADEALPLSGDIFLFMGTAIPVGYVLCNGSNNTPNMLNRMVKNNLSPGSISLGGSDTHGHGPQTHGHGLPLHDHTGTVGNPPLNMNIVGNADRVWTHGTPPHTLASVSTETGSLSTESTTANESSNLPEYMSVLFIEFKFGSGGGASVIPALQ